MISQLKFILQRMSEIANPTLLKRLVNGKINLMKSFEVQ